MSQIMMKRRIQEAQQYIDEHALSVQKQSMRQRYHFMGQCGWINDPNGLIYYKGKYHFFYQFNPFGSFWSEMYWGHAVSTDMLHWKYLPIALAPSESYDDHPQGGCFSGTAIAKDGRLYLMYAGTANHGHGFEQTINIAWSYDGIHFTKYKGNPVILPPEGVPHNFFRDPKVWQHEGMYYSIVGAQKRGHACALLYISKDLLHWTFKNVLFESKGEWGYMWECPDFFPIKNKWIFLCSPMGAGERTTVYFVGDFDYETGTFMPDRSGELDWGYDFYAPQTLLDKDGERVLVGWANCWDWMPFWKDWGPTYQQGWCGSFSIPRKIVLNDDLTVSTPPIDQIAVLRKNITQCHQITISRQPTSIHAGDGIAFDLRLAIDLASAQNKVIDFAIRKDKKNALHLIFDFEHAQITVDRRHADGWSTGVTSACFVVRRTGTLPLEILGDKSSIEIFVENGKLTFSMNDFALDTCNLLTAQTQGGTIILRNIKTSGMCTITR